MNSLAVRPELDTGRRHVLAGVAGLTFLVLIAAQNVLRGALGPTNDASTADLFDLRHINAWSIHVLVATYALGFPALLLFGSGLTVWCSRAEPRSAVWASVGQASTLVISVLFGLVNALQVTMVAARDELDAAPELGQLLWVLHNAVFTINMIAIGLALFALGRAAALARLIPSWMKVVTALGGLLLVAAAVPAVAVVQGSMWMSVGLLGFLLWMVFVAVAGVALLRRGPVAKVDPASPQD
jgi:Domain of unknown function (DUF4386)